MYQFQRWWICVQGVRVRGASLRCGRIRAWYRRILSIPLGHRERVLQCLRGSYFDPLRLSSHSRPGFPVRLLVIKGDSDCRLTIFIYTVEFDAWNSPRYILWLRLPSIPDCIEWHCLAVEKRNTTAAKAVTVGEHRFNYGQAAFDSL